MIASPHNVDHNTSKTLLSYKDNWLEGYILLWFNNMMCKPDTDDWKEQISSRNEINRLAPDSLPHVIVANHNKPITKLNNPPAMTLENKLLMASASEMWQLIVSFADKLLPFRGTTLIS